MPEPLLPEHYPTVPFFDASAAAGDPARIRSIADELGYLYLRNWIPVPRVEAVRAFVRSFAVARGWIEPAEGNPPVLLARKGAGLAGRGWDDPAWIELQQRLVGAPGSRRLSNAARSSACSKPCLANLSRLPRPTTAGSDCRAAPS